MSARSLNRVQLIGNLTRDPELRYTPSGTAVCTFGLATNRSWVASDGGDRQEETEYHRVVAWAKLAEICSQLLFKGRKVFVEGRLQTRKWTGQDGQERETTEVVIDNMIALGAPKNRDNGGGNEEEIYGDDFGSAYGTDGASMATPSDYSNAPAATTKKANESAASSQAPVSNEANKEEKVDLDDIPF